MDDEAGERAGARRLLLVPVVVRPLLVLKARVRSLTHESSLALHEGAHACSEVGFAGPVAHVAGCAALSHIAHLLLFDRHHELLELLGELKSSACLDFFVADDEDAAAAVLECWHACFLCALPGGKDPLCVKVLQRKVGLGAR